MPRMSRRLHVAVVGPRIVGSAVASSLARHDTFVTCPVTGLPLPTPLVVDAVTGVWWRPEGKRLPPGRSNPAEPTGARPEARVA